MRKIYLLLASYFVSSAALAQVFDGPESCEKDYADGGVFVSNASAGNIVKLMPNGTLQSFASGFTAGPHGLELIGDTLYACDGASIVLVNRSTGAIINTVNLGATFLNGITHAGKNLFITDFSAKKIYRMNTVNNSFNVFCSTLTKTPNGIVYDYHNNRLVYCCWGSSAPVYEVILADSTINLLGTTATGNCDGIAMNCQGDFFISSWSPNAIKKYNSSITTMTPVTLSGLGSPADIYFDLVNDTLYIPNSGNNTVTKTNQPSCVTSVAECYCMPGEEGLYPNPFYSALQFNNQENFSSLRLNDMSGKQVYTVKLEAGNNFIPVGDIPVGVYVCQLVSPFEIRTVKVCKEK
ncbi:MAG TPA: T9SS type A sorting domain-containing protein [Flavobacteriales bacterium]|nr:T9SS type A sorting domain-containing protein [Flavobacteriales bacterium]